MKSHITLFIGYLCISLWSTLSLTNHQVLCNTDPIGQPSPQEVLEKLKPEDPYLNYNKGTAYLKLNRNALALVYLTQAHFQFPDDQDVQFNYKLAKKSLSDREMPLPSIFIEMIGEWDQNFWISPLLIAFFIFITLKLKPPYSLAAFRQGNVASWSGVVLWMVSALMIIGRVTHFEHPYSGVIESTQLMSGPGPNYLNLGRLEEGQWVRVLYCSNSWCQIRAQGWNESTLKAWLPESTLLRIGSG